MSIRNSLDWFRAQSKPVQVLMILGAIVVLLVSAMGAAIGTAVVGTFVMPAGEPIGSANPTPIATPVETTVSESTATSVETPPTSPPQVQFSLSPADGSVTITHAGGDSIRAGWLWVNVEGEARGTWASHDDSLDPTDDVAEEASITVTDVSSGDAIELVWSPPDRDPMPVARFSVP